MSTCKDCVHYDVCKSLTDFTDEFIKSCEKNFDKYGDAKEKCEYFKDKSKSVDLPCKVGNIVFCIDKEYEDYTGYIFLGCNEKYAFVRGGINGSFDADTICDYAYERFLEWEEGVYCVPLNALYFSKEEAEQALAERSK